MQFYKKKEGTNLNNEYIKMIEEINSEQINNVCFECGTGNPEYISINNGVFICQECVQDHLQFPREISTIVINDLYSLNNNEVKRLYLGGNKKLIEFINFDFPRLKQFPPNILYKTRAVDYYRKRLDFYIKGGIKPLKPIFESAYQLINLPNNNDNLNYKKEIFLSPKANISEKIFNTTELTPILEGNQLEDENNLSSYSDEKNKEETYEDQKKNCLQSQDSNIKNESTFIYSPQKPKTLNGNSVFINSNNSLLNKSSQNESKNNNKTNSKIDTYNINIKNSYKKEKEKEKINDDSNKQVIKQEEVKFNSDKNISDINSGDYSNLNINNEKNNVNNLNINDDNFGDDNTIRIIDNCMNISKENDSSDYIKNNKSYNDSIQINLKDKNEDDNISNRVETDSSRKKENDRSIRIINISNIENISDQSNKQVNKNFKNTKQDNYIYNNNDKTKDTKNNIKNKTNNNNIIKNDKVLRDKIIIEKVITDKNLKNKILADKTINDKVITDKNIKDKVIKEKVIEDKNIKDKVIEDKVIKNKNINDKVIKNKVIDDNVINKKPKKNKVENNINTNRSNSKKKSVTNKNTTTKNMNNKYKKNKNEVYEYESQSN